MQESDTDFKAYFEEINREAKEREEAKKTKKRQSPELVEGQSPELVEGPSPKPVRHAQGELRRREPQKPSRTKAAETVDHLAELHKLQGTLLTQLKKQV